MSIFSRSNDWILTLCYHLHSTLYIQTPLNKFRTVSFINDTHPIFKYIVVNIFVFKCCDWWNVIVFAEHLKVMHGYNSSCIFLPISAITIHKYYGLWWYTFMQTCLTLSLYQFIVMITVISVQTLALSEQLRRILIHRIYRDVKCSKRRFIWRVFFDHVA